MLFDVYFAQILSFGPPSQTSGPPAELRREEAPVEQALGVTLTVIQGRILHRIGRGLNGILRFKMNIF